MYEKLMSREVSVEEALLSGLPVIDVRSPGEFSRGHIPGAFNIPLFTDEERAQVGTTYKQISAEEAIKLGYQLVTPKFDWFVTEAKKVAPNGKAVVHCWRGGMRSEAFAQHLVNNGFQIILRIKGGYKAYRNFVLTEVGKPLNLIVLGGFTGSGKSLILKELQKLGQQTIDLEYLANHRGSVFGGLGMGKQPTVEQFENNLHYEISKLSCSLPIWVEDESHNIGTVKIPLPFFEQMQRSYLIFVQIPAEERIPLLVQEYAHHGKEKLAEAIYKISKRLGGQNVQLAIKSLEENNFEEVARIALKYYDKIYLKSLSKHTHDNIIPLTLPSINTLENALKILKTAKEHQLV